MGPHLTVAIMTNASTIYVPASVAERVEDVHQRAGRPGDPKWRTVERAVSEFVEDGGTDE